MSVDYIENFDNVKAESASSNSLIDELYESRRAKNGISNDAQQNQAATSVVNELFGGLEIVDTANEKPHERIQNTTSDQADLKLESKIDSNGENAATSNSFEDILFTLLMKYAEKKDKKTASS